MGCVHHLCILCTLLPGIYASLIVHSKSATWANAGVTCVSNNQILVNRFDEQMIQNLTSCVNKEDLTFWTGGYTGTSLTDWIAFHGCFFVNNQRSIIRMNSQSHTVWSCYQLCRRLMFGLTINSCVCFGNITLSLQTFEKTNYCIHGNEEFMGINGSMAIYKYAAEPRKGSEATSQLWCSVYCCNGSRNYYSGDCKNTARYKCENGFSSSEVVTWDEAVRACLNKGSFLQGTISDKGCSSTPGLIFWSYVRRFREHSYVTKNTRWNSNIIECEILHVNRGSITLERTTNCSTKLLPYVCQSDDENLVIYNESFSERCNSQNVTVKVTHTSPGKLVSPVSESSREGTTSTMYHENIWTSDGKSETTSYTRSHLTNKAVNKTRTTGYTTQIFTTQSLVHIKETSSTPFLNTQDRPLSGYPETEVSQSGRTVHTPHHTIPDTSTHAVHNVVASKKDSQVGLIAGVVAGCVVAVVAVVVILVFCRKASRKKNENAENKNVPPASNPAYDSWLYANTSTNSAKEREVTVDENNSICDIELYDVSGEGDYDHLRSNNRRIKKEIDYMYDTTAQVKAEEEMYSSTRKGNSYVESSDFYDSMQRIKNEGEDLYDHSMTASNYSQTSLYSMAQHCSDPTEF